MACNLARNGAMQTGSIPDFLGVSHDTLDRIFLARTGKALHAWRRSTAWHPIPPTDAINP